MPEGQHSAAIDRRDRANRLQRDIATDQLDGMPTLSSTAPSRRLTGGSLPSIEAMPLGMKENAFRSNRTPKRGPCAASAKMLSISPEL